MVKLLPAAAVMAALSIPPAFAQGAHVGGPNAGTSTPAVCSGTRVTALTGTVRDSTLALIPGAALTLDGRQTATSGSDGHFRFSCVSNGVHHLTATAQGFAAGDLSVSLPRGAEIQLVLQPESVTTNVQVNADEQTIPDTNSSGATTTLSGKQLQSLADDPDDLLRELQQLGAAGGGNPANTTIAVDGFQGSSKLPPKSSIAYIKVNPDQFSAEYREPPFDGGRVEVYTKPGQPTFHGALFATNGSPWENARDPFSTSKASLGKQRYGFELTGPVQKKGSDFALDLEHRSIDNYAVVNAITLDDLGDQVSTNANVATPQRLWIGQAKFDLQLGAKNTLISSYSANVNDLQNVGVGGTMLADTGYNSGTYEHILRFTNITTASVHLMHEARLSLRWDGETDVPNSTATQVNVAGSFTSGGATIGQQRLHEFNIEFDDDAILTAKAHTLKFGTQLMTYTEHQQLTTNFNGTYTFGGGTAPVLDANNLPIGTETETITGLEQYRRAELGLPGGTPTAFSNVVGTPGVDFTQTQNAFFIQDDWNAGHGVHISGGVRYFFETNPNLYAGANPRLGILWSPGKKGTWTLHAHAGLFTGTIAEATTAEVLREDGVHRITSTVYNPVYGDPLTGSTPIHSARQYSPHIGATTWGAENLGGTRTLPHGWNVMGDFFYGRVWNDTFSPNINSPLNGSPTGPRPGVANLDLLQVTNGAQDRFIVTFVGVEQHTLKYVQLFAGAVRVNGISDTDNSDTFSPQNAYNLAGEFAHNSNQPVWQTFGNATFTLPKKVQLSGDFNARGDQHYNITTGFDNNGDGNFNDRPQYAAPGTPLCSSGNANTVNCAVPTAYGLLVDSGGVGVFPRNKGQLPWKFYLDTNLQRAFTLTHNAKAEHPQVLTVNLRSSNLLNHTNITQVGSVLGTPFFGVPYQADNGRRVEAGLRYTF